MKFYAPKLKRTVEINDNNVRAEIRNKTLFAVGIYWVKGRPYEAWRIIKRL